MLDAFRMAVSVLLQACHLLHGVEAESIHMTYLAENQGVVLSAGDHLYV